MNHALSAGVMIVAGLLFTSCTATLMQNWATTRAPAAASAAAPLPAYTLPGRQGVARPQPPEECLPGQTGDSHTPGGTPKFTPVRSEPKT
jgi:hypothetical protein